MEYFWGDDDDRGDSKSLNSGNIFTLQKKSVVIMVGTRHGTPL
jgi:hypothetical protein